MQGNNFSKVYGSANPIFTGTVLGIRNNDIITPSFSTTATSLSGVGVYVITSTATGSNVNNYALIINNSQLTITPLSFVSTAASPIVFNSTVYDGSPKIPSVVGLPSTSGVNYTYNGSTTAPSNAGTYTVVGIITDPNYTGTVTSVIVISPSDLSNQLSVAGLSNSVYDGSPKPTSITGLPLGVASTISYNGSTTAPTNAGTYTVVGIVNDANYVGTTTSVMVIMPVMATITAFNATRTYGAANPVFTGSIAGIFINDVITPSFTTLATSLSGVGNYAISATASGVNINNYELTINNSQLTITKANLTVTASSFTMVYGGALPTFTSTIIGLVNNDVVNIDYSTSAIACLVAPCPLSIIPSVSGLALANYNLTTLDGVLTITKANATITAFNATKTYGAANPVFTGSIAGIVNGDMISGLYGSEATQTSNVGNYAITATATGANIDNYTFSIINSQLTISEAASTVTVSGASANGILTSATSITISGVGFESGAMITVNGVAIQNFTVVSGTTIIANISANLLSTTGNIILVQNPNQLASANTPVVITNATLNINYELLIINYELSIVPNPTLGEFKIQNAEIGSELLIFNAQGKVVFSQKIIDETTTVNAHLSSGIYLVKVGNQSKKLIVNG